MNQKLIGFSPLALMMGHSATVFSVYVRLLKRFGEQKWWPAESPFEVILGAILTQRSNWRNVEMAISNLRQAGLLSVEAIVKTDVRRLRNLLRPSGFFRQKTDRILDFSSHLMRGYEGNLDKFFVRDLQKVREELLSLKGIGEETADSILLYAGEKTTFVVDAYTIRILNRLGLSKSTRYNETKRFLEKNLPENLQLYKEYHALFVALGKMFCQTIPRCDGCPLTGYCAFHSPQT
jgi:endonuclease-3 related protein